MNELRVVGLARAFGGVRAVDTVSFTLEPGSITALIGPNGAGKSTLFNLVDGQLVPDAGEIEFEGRTLVGVPTAERTQAGIGRTFQVAQTFASMTVLQNAQLALLVAAGVAMSPGVALDRRVLVPAQRLLQQVGLGGRESVPAATLAYGDLKRLELALALAAAPRLLLMDEPTAGMAPGERTALMSLVVELARARGMTVLFTEHSMDVVFGFAERVLVMSRGRLIADGTPETVRADAGVRAVYLGDEA
ncbi:MAG TPA: ATP-binding cassette domain-containing protein [Burkholderiaceae bacterium]|nr:ATP-binding cassette domain-containing protein [Burkholderiaceae bacterium]HQR69511.1 ATP-binding cassette domain-containing protein [Burkholderiaceae bacterium]